MRKLAIAAVATLLLVWVGAAVVLAGQMPGAIRSATLLNAVTRGSGSLNVSPVSEQDRGSQDEDCAGSQAQSSEDEQGADEQGPDEQGPDEQGADEQGADMDECGQQNQSDAARQQQGANEPEGDNDRQGPKQSQGDNSQHGDDQHSAAGGAQR